MQETTWMATSRKRKTYPPLRKKMSAETVVVGGGLAGMLTAFLLRMAGKEVVVIESGEIGRGATAYTTAFITQYIDTKYIELQSLFGEKEAELIFASHGAAIDALEEIVFGEKINCEFSRIPAKIYANKEDELKDIEEEHRAIAKAGFSASFHRGKSMNFGRKGYMEIPLQAKFHPLKFLFGLTARAEKAGVRIFEKTEAKKIRENKAGVTIELKNGKTIEAQDVVIATYYPLGNPKKTLFKKAMYDSYVLEAEIPKGEILEGMYWDTESPYHYLRVDPLKKMEDRLIIGGEDHRSEIKISPKKSFAALEDYLKEIMQGRPYKIIHKWNGPILEPSDGLALIGRVKPHEYVATAFSGNGMTYSMISALLIRDLITGEENPWTDLYDPTRGIGPKKLAQKALDYTEELVGGALHNAIEYRGK